jgi:hypothetical protein
VTMRVGRKKLFFKRNMDKSVLSLQNLIYLMDSISFTALKGDFKQASLISIFNVFIFFKYFL